MKKIYDKLNKEWIAVTDDFYTEYSRQIGTFIRNEKRRNHCRCKRSMWWLCDTDCPTCEFYTGNDCDSLNAPVGETDIDLIDTLVSDAPSVESIVEGNELLNALYAELNQLSDEELKICQLLINYSKTDAAKKMGISRDALKRRCKRLAKKFEKIF